MRGATAWGIVGGAAGLGVEQASSGSPAGYDAWLTQASTYGTITAKERAAVSALFASLNAAGIRTKMYQLYLLGGDDAAFSTAALRRSKRGLNVINPTGTGLTYAGTVPVLSSIGCAWTSPASYGDSVLTGTDLGIVNSNFGYFQYITTFSNSVENSSGMNGANIYLSPRNSNDFVDIWGNPPSGPGGAMAADDLHATQSTTSIGTGIRTYRNGSLLGSGANGTAIPSVDSAHLTIAWVPSSGGNNHNGAIPSAGTFQALSAAEHLALNNAIKAYRTAIA